VPLVEGADFDQFLSRVRRRLLLAEGCSVALRAEDGRTVDSIEGLLEVDESATLLVASDSPSGGGAAAADPAASASRLRGAAAASPARPGAGPSNGSCRVDIPVSEWARSGRRGGEHEETGDLKYRKRRGGLAVNLQRLRTPIIVIAVMVGAGLVGLRVLSARA
jgi:hypothetical protein